MSINFNRDQRRIFAEKLLELANIAVGGLVFGQLLSDRKFSLNLAITGLITLVIIYIIAYLMLKRS